jgi:hypothetical protein
MIDLQVLLLVAKISAIFSLDGRGGDPGELLELEERGVECALAESLCKHLLLCDSFTTPNVLARRNSSLVLNRLDEPRR